MNRLSTAKLKTKLWNYADRLGGPVDQAPAEPYSDVQNAGRPSIEDPDPFGVLALEKQGLQIVEAGTHVAKNSSSEEFKSPVHSTFRQSFQSGSSRNESWRTSQASISINRERKYDTSDMSTQTESLEDAHHSQNTTQDQNQVGFPQKREHGSQGRTSLERAPIADQEADQPTSDDNSKGTEDEPEVSIEEVTQATRKAPQVRLVAVPKRTPPALPPRNPGRARHTPVVTEHDLPCTSASKGPSNETSSSSSVDVANTLRHMATSARSGASVTPLDTSPETAAFKEGNANDFADDSSISGESFVSGEESPVVVATAVMASSVARQAPSRPTEGPAAADPRIEHDPDPELERTEVSKTMRITSKAEDSAPHGTVSTVDESFEFIARSKAADCRIDEDSPRISIAGIRGDLQADDDDEDGYDGVDHEETSQNLEMVKIKDDASFSRLHTTSERV